jgi:protein-tyrosine-phosphatase
VTEVPDPYYGQAADFEYVIDLAEDFSENIVQMIKRKAPLI